MIRPVSKASSELLLALEHEEGVAGVYRDRANGFHWLSGGEDGGSGMTERRFTFEGLRKAWVYGGFLPAGAARVRARDVHGAWSEGVVGNGVWLAITRARPLAARFEHASGSIVPRPLDALERETVPDAAAPCAACGGTAWELALLAPVHAGESEHRAVVCLRCGHQAAMGTWYASPGDGSEMDPQPPGDWWRERVDAMRWVFAEADFPIYGLAGWKGERSWRGHGTSLGRVTQVTLAFGGLANVVVETCRERATESHERLLERALEQLLTPSPSGDAWRRLSPAALTVLMEHDQLRAGERVAAVVTHELTIPLQRGRRRFLAGRHGERWAAVTTLSDEELTVTITADRIAPEAVALERVSDIEPFLRASRPGT
jgi:hypothetical protein